MQASLSFLSVDSTKSNSKSFAYTLAVLLQQMKSGPGGAVRPDQIKVVVLSVTCMGPFEKVMNTAD